jgi:hypothetical protein
MRKIKIESYRSKPLVNMTDDMQRVTITGTVHEIREMLRCLERNAIYFNFDFSACMQNEEKEDE